MDIGELCVGNEQCRGTANSTVCENSTCTCAEGYISSGEQCYEGEIKNPQYKSKMVNKVNEFEQCYEGEITNPEYKSKMVSKVNEFEQCYEGEIKNPQYKSKMVNKVNEFEKRVNKVRPHL